MINKGTKGHDPPKMRTFIKAIIITGLGTLLIALAPVQTVNSTTIENLPVAAVKAPEQTITPVVPAKPIVEPVQAPQPQPAPAIVSPLASGNCDLAFSYDWPQQVAYAVCMAESGGNTNATNMNDNHGSCVGSYGLFQVGCFWYGYYGYEISHDPNVNAQIAYNIWKRQGGFGAWTTYTSGKYLKYM
jgi:Lysozyme like domain